VTIQLAGAIPASGRNRLRSVGEQLRKIVRTQFTRMAATTANRLSGKWSSGSTARSGSRICRTQAVAEMVIEAIEERQKRKDWACLRICRHADSRPFVLRDGAQGTEGDASKTLSALDGTPRPPKSCHADGRAILAARMVLTTGRDPMPRTKRSCVTSATIPSKPVLAASSDAWPYSSQRRPLP